MKRLLLAAAIAFAGCASLRDAPGNEPTKGGPSSKKFPPDDADNSATSDTVTTFQDPDGGGTFLPASEGGVDPRQPDPTPPPTCNGGLCQPQRIVDRAFVKDLVLDGDDLYLAGDGIQRCKKASCDPTSITGSAPLGRPVVTGGKIYWIAFYGDSIKTCDVDNCNDAPTTLLTDDDGDMRGLVTDGTNLYFTSSKGLHSCPRTNCSKDTVVDLQATDVANDDPLALADGTIFWGDQQGRGLEAVSTVTGHETTINHGAAQDVWTDGTHLVWVAGHDVASCTIGQSCDAPMLLPPMHAPLMPMTDGTAIYFVDSVQFIARCPLTGCPPEGVEVIADMGQLEHIQPVPPVVDADYIYWTTAAGVYRLPKH